MPELLFDRARLDTDRRQLLLDDEAVDVQPLVFDLLSFMARHPRRAISKSELLAAVWRSNFVSDSVVARAVMKARRAILDDAAAPRLLRTLPRVGYLLDTDVTERTTAGMGFALALPLGSGGSTLVVMPFDDATENPSLAWIAQGLMGLLHHLLEVSGGLVLVPIGDVNQALRSLPNDSDRMAQACINLGAEAALQCRISWDSGAFTLQAWRGSRVRDAAQFVFTGPDAIEVTRQLADALANKTERHTGADGDTFWHEQLAKALELHQTGHHAKAFDLLESCRPFVEESAQLDLLRARLLQECNRLDAARDQIGLALQRPEAADANVLRVQLLALRGWCDLEADRLTPSRTDLEEALRLSEAVPGARSMRPDILCRAASVAARQGDGPRAIRMAEAAVEEATRMGQLGTQARAWLQLASMLNQMDQQYRAEPAVERAVELARQSGVAEYEARAWRLQANVQNYRRHHTAALKSVRRSIAMWVRCGNVAMLLWARLMELVVLVESDQLEGAQAAAATLATHEGLQPAHIDTLQFLNALIEWKLGRTEASIAALNALTARVQPETNITLMLAHSELAFMQAHQGEVGRAAEAAAGMVALPTLGASERRRAAVALAAGDRPLAVELLRGLWQSPRMRGIEGMNIVLDLTWLLLEQVRPGFEDAELATLFAHVLDFSEEPLAVNVVRTGYLLRLNSNAHSKEQWGRTIADARPLRLRFPLVLTPAYRDALAHGSPPRLRELITRVCW